MKKVINIVFWFLFRALGFYTLTERIESKVTNYRLRLNIVPVSFKIFMWMLGVVTGATGMYAYEHHDSLFVPKSDWSFEQVVKIQPVEAKIVKDEGRDLVSIIHKLESSEGKKNYSKCAEKGLYNEYGFAIPGNGKYVCFEKGQDKEAVEGWISFRKALGYTEKELLCEYNTGDKDSDCQYYKDSFKVK